MLEALRPQAPDRILALTALCRDDPRTAKIDLGVGVYRDARGRTPVMRAVKAAERRLVETQDSKSYTGLAGDPAFAAAMLELILGPGFADRAAAVATPGGTGACRQGFDLIRLAAPGARLWLSDPTWPNHPSIARHLGLPVATYPWLDAAGGVAFGAMLRALQGAARGDVVLLHGCCHNPSGADLSPGQWHDLAAVLAARGLVPFVDLAYQGFGDGLTADASGTRLLARTCPEMLIAASCSKSFGIYRERTGLLVALTDPARVATVQGNLAWLNRQNYSFPPDHGARVVTAILTDPDLRAEWAAELDAIRGGMLALRQALADALRRATDSDRFDFVARHRGMFSRLGLTETQVDRLREEHAIYIVADSRINIAGLNAATVPVLARAVQTVL